MVIRPLIDETTTLHDVLNVVADWLQFQRGAFRPPVLVLRERGGSGMGLFDSQPVGSY